MRRRIVIAGGGTAGHVYPGLALARTLRERGHDAAFVGTAQGLEARLVPAAGFELALVPAAPLLRRLSPATLGAPLVALRAVKTSRAALAGADVVVSMGGYVSVPAVLAARRERLPVVVHEQNAVPGLANRLAARAARSIALSFADAASGLPRRARARAVVTGNPVRAEILRVPAERDALVGVARVELGLEEGRRTVVIFGGSQGALHIDRAAVGAARLLADRSDLQLVVITGPAHLESVRRGLRGDGGLTVRTLGYLERMELAFAVADLVVCRAGATTIAELTVCGVPALLVPYPFATGGHQEANARALQRAGGASLMLDDELSAEALAERIGDLAGHDERLRSMRERALAVAHPDAAERLADLVERAAVGDAA